MEPVLWYEYVLLRQPTTLHYYIRILLDPASRLDSQDHALNLIMRLCCHGEEPTILVARGERLSPKRVLTFHLSPSAIVVHCRCIRLNLAVPNNLACVSRNDDRWRITWPTLEEGGGGSSGGVCYILLSTNLDRGQFHKAKKYVITK